METRDLYEFGPFRADGTRRSLTRNGEAVPLPGKAFDVLYVLIRESGRTVLKDRLIKEVWPDTFVEEGNLSQMIFLARKALGEDEDGQSLIVTVARQGYRFVGHLKQTAADQTVPAEEPASPPVPASPTRIGTTPQWWIGAALAIVSGLGGWLFANSRAGESLTADRVVRYTINPPASTTYRVGRVSPDGRSLALLGVNSEGQGQLFLRRLDALSVRPLANAEYWPFWSPDGRYIAFAQNGQLKRIGVSGGASQTICAAPLVIGGSWSREGTIIFGDGDVILRVQVGGGDAQPLTRLDASRGETTHDFPVFLPDAHHFLYTIHSVKRENGGIFLGSIDSPDTRIRLLADVSNTEYAPDAPPDTGHLLFVRGGTLMAQSFGAADFRLKGEAFPVAEKIAQDPGNLSASFSASAGVLLVTPTYSGDQLTWFDRLGNRLGTLGRPGLHFSPQLSPDEQTVAADAVDPERFSSDIWFFPVAGTSASRLTFNGSVSPVWAPDGGRVVFETMNTALHSKTSSGTESEHLLLESSGSRDDDRLPCEWSRDGRFVYSQRNQKTGYDLWVLPMSGGGKATPFIHSEYNEWCGTLSPDSKWIAYASDASGRSEIYVQAFSETVDSSASVRKWQISENGGHWPKWRRDGKELLYLSAARDIVSVEVAGGPGFHYGIPKRLFASSIRTPDARFDVSADGRRFLIPAAVTAPTSEPATVVLNWMSKIAR